MGKLFLCILDMSLTASYVIIAIVLIRLLLRKAPKKWSYLLWSVVAFRLCCPISFQAVFSLFNLRPASSTGRATAGNAEELINTLPEHIAMAQPQAAVKVPSINDASIPISPEMTAPLSINWLTVAAVIWLLGIAALMLVGIVSYARLHREMMSAMVLEGNVYQSDRVRSPFILGFVRPKIYIPFRLDADTQRYVLAHEQYHIRRLDHIIRPFAFLLLTLHWFNPLCWLAFHLMGRDMEMSCDEKVLAGEVNIRRAYSTSLLSFAANRRFPTPSPLAFSESGVKSRVKNALNWKRPKAWVTVVAAMLCIAVVAACATDPVMQSAQAADTSQAKPNSSTAAHKVVFHTETNDMNEYVQSMMDAAKTVTYYTAGGEIATANVVDAKLDILRKCGSVEGLYAEHTLELWNYCYLVKLDIDTNGITVADTMYESDGWYCQKQSDRYVIVARAPDGGYNILADEPFTDSMCVGSYERCSGVLYDWYITEYGLDHLPKYHKNIPEYTNNTVSAALYDGDGWYIYLPTDGWKISGPRQWSSASNVSTLSVKKLDSTAQEQMDYLAEAGWEFRTNPARMACPAGNVQDYYINDPNGGCYQIRIQWDETKAARQDSFIYELYCLQAMAQSFTVDSRISGDSFKHLLDTLAITINES